MFGEIDVLFGRGGAVTVTVAELVVFPPGPVQSNVYVAVPIADGVSVAVPLVPQVPDHAPDAVHDVAPVVLHVIVVDAPRAIVEGEAEIVTVGKGGAVTVTAAELVRLPPGPVQSSVYVVVPMAVGVSVIEPATACVPDHAPDAVQLVTLLVLHVIVVDAPSASVEGDAEIVTTSIGVVTITVAELVVLPPGPVQSSVYVAVPTADGVSVAEPLVPQVPDHAPDAMQDVALVVLHVIVVDTPSAIVEGEAEIVAVGGGAVTVTLAEPDFVESSVEVAVMAAGEIGRSSSRERE